MGRVGIFVEEGLQHFQALGIAGLVFGAGQHIGSFFAVAFGGQGIAVGILAHDVGPEGHEGGREGFLFEKRFSFVEELLRRRVFFYAGLCRSQ